MGRVAETAAAEETPVEETPIAITGEIAPEMMGETDADYFAVELEAGDKLAALTAMGPSMTALDTTLTLYNPALTQIDYDDDNGDRAFSNIGSVEVSEAGTYYLAVRGFGNSSGDYTLIVVVTPAP